MPCVAKDPRRLHVADDVLSRLHHQMTGRTAADVFHSEVPRDGTIVVGFKQVFNAQGLDAHLAYLVLLGAPTMSPVTTPRCATSYQTSKHISIKSEAHSVVERRYSQFDMLRAVLQPRAQRLGIVLPRFPSKLCGFGRKLSSCVGRRRQQALQVWLRAVVDEPLLLCAELVAFLGLPKPLRCADASVWAEIASQSVPEGEPSSVKHVMAALRSIGICDVHPATSLPLPAWPLGSCEQHGLDEAPPAVYGERVDLVRLQTESPEQLMEICMLGEEPIGMCLRARLNSQTKASHRLADEQAAILAACDETETGSAVRRPSEERGDTANLVRPSQEAPSQGAERQGPHVQAWPSHELPVAVPLCDADGTAAARHHEPAVASGCAALSGLG